jgi:hypothetical protein
MVKIIKVLFLDGYFPFKRLKLQILTDNHQVQQIFHLILRGHLTRPHRFCYFEIYFLLTFHPQYLTHSQDAFHLKVFFYLVPLANGFFGLIIVLILVKIAPL